MQKKYWLLIFPAKTNKMKPWSDVDVCIALNVIADRSAAGGCADALLVTWCVIV
jgi:hypothetical protein